MAVGVFTKATNLLNVTRTTTSNAYASTTDRQPLYYYESGDYDQVASIHFQAVMRAGSGDTAYMELYNFTDSASVTGSEVSTTSTVNVVVISGDITANMTTAKDYLTRWKADDGAGGAPANTSSFDRATFNVKQSGAITKTRTDIELGEDNDVPSTSYTAPTNYGIFLFESARFDGTVTIFLEAVLRCQSSGDTTYGALYDITAGAQVSSSEVSHTGNTTKTRKRSGAITLVDGHEYRPDIKGTSTSDDVASIGIIIKQTGTPTKTDCYTPILNTSTSGTTTTYSYQNRYLDFDASDYSGDTKVFKFEATLNSSSGNTAYYQLYNDTDAGELAVVTTTSATYVRVRDDTVTMPTDDNNVLNSGRKIDTAGTVSVGRAFLIAQIDWTAATNYTDDLVDSEGLTDTLARTVTYTRSVVDSIGLTDGNAYQLSISINLGDSIGVTDTISRQISVLRNIVDNQGITDILNATNSYNRSVVDTQGITDGVTYTLSISINISDSIGLTDVVSKSSIHAPNISDVIGATDTNSRQVASVRNIRDVEGLADSVARTVSYVLGLTDVEGLTDTIARQVSAMRSVVDSMSVADVNDETNEEVASDTNVQTYIGAYYFGLYAPTAGQTVTTEFELSDTLSISDLITVVVGTSYGFNPDTSIDQVVELKLSISAVHSDSGHVETVYEDKMQLSSHDILKDGNLDSIEELKLSLEQV